MILGPLLALAFSFGLLFIVLPRVIFPLHRFEGTFLDRWLAGFVFMSALSAAAMYVFSAFNMMETFALIIVWVGTWWVLKGRHQESGRLARLAHRFFTLADTTEQRGTKGAASEVGNQTRERLGDRTRGWVSNAREALTDPGTVITLVSLLVIIGVSAFMRFERALTNVELVPQDSYLALFATKDITAGNLLQEGIYPQGAYLWMSLLDRFYVLDTFSFVRFAGPLMSTLELLALYWVVSRVSRSRAAGVLSTAVFGLFAGVPALFIDWQRQIGSMTQEFSLAFAVIAIAFGASYMAKHRQEHLWAAGAALFMAVTSHTMSVLVCGIGFAVILLAGLLTASWTVNTFRRIVIVAVGAAIAGHIFLPLGLLNGQGLALSYFQYTPTNFQGFGEVGPTTSPAAGMDGVAQALTGNLFFQLGFIGALIASVIGAVLALRGSRNGRMLLAFGGSVLAFLLFFDLIAVRFGLLFRVRVGYVAGELIAAGMGLAVGALVVAASELVDVSDPLWERYRGSLRAARSGIEIAGLVLAAVILVALWPREAQANRGASPSGYPQATQVTLEIIDEEPRLTCTLVGPSEQYQEGAFNCWHVESWVFARDIRFSDARDPSYELPIPTDDVYVFAEKVPFSGPQSASWYGATEEYYRTEEKRARIMERIFLWMEEYRRVHNDVEIFYDDPELRVYHVERNVGLARAERTSQFKNYSYNQGDFFADDEDITAEQVRPDPDAPNQRTDGRGGQ